MDLRRSSRIAVTISFLLLVVAVAVEGNVVVMNVQHKFGGRGRGIIGKSLLGSLREHDIHRHGRMLSAVDLPLGGNGQPTDAALYFTKLRIGTPPRDYHVQVDTGSDILWINCAGCDQCPKKSSLGIELAKYDLRTSATGKIVTCDQDFCFSAQNVPYSDCKVGMTCEYMITYGDGSRTGGYFVRDRVTLDQVSGNRQTTAMNGTIAFGCSDKQSGELGTSTEAVDGIVGLGQANSSIISQLAMSGKVKKMFAHCLDGNNGGGIFALGEVVQPKVKSTPLIPNKPHYNINLKAIEVGGDVLDIPTDIFGSGSGEGTVIDSGTTLAYLPNGIYNPLIAKIMAKQPTLKFHIVEQQFKCIFYAGNIDDAFPVVTFDFENSLSLVVYPHDYFFQVHDNEWCVGWQQELKDGGDRILLGDLALSSKLVLYDLENQTIGWTEYNCSSSIKVKDEASGNVYTVGSHNLSSAYSIHTGKILTLFLFVVIICSFIV